MAFITIIGRLYFDKLLGVLTYVFNDFFLLREYGTNNCFDVYCIESERVDPS